MGKNKNTIEINGQVYNATTGALLSHGATHIKKSTRKNVDGVIAGTIIKPAPSIARHTPKTVTPVAKKVSTPKHASRRPKASAGHAVQHSSTLMRHTVKKPTPQAKRHIKSHSNTDAAASHDIVTAKLSAHSLNTQRLTRAQKTAKSQHVSRFGEGSHLAPSSKSVAHKATMSAHAIQRPVRRPSAPHHQKTTADILQDALHHATSHKQAPPKRHKTSRQRLASFSVLTVSAAILIGFAAFQTMPTIKVRLASAQAGFAASLPGYNPSGFHMDGLDYGAGVVAMNYMSNSDGNRKFAITQKASSWDSNTLRDMFVEGKDKNFRIVEEGGRTLFFYGQNNATWVDNGVWYQVQSTGSLSDRQLVDIAKSL